MNTLPAGLQELRNDYLHIMLDENANLLYSKWVRNPSKEEYRAAIATFIDCIKSKNIKYWIMDSVELKDVSMDDQIWAIQQIAAVAPQTSLKKVARIATDDSYMSKLLVVANQLHSELRSGVDVQQFHCYREAAEWIEEEQLDS